MREDERLEMIRTVGEASAGWRDLACRLLGLPAKAVALADPEPTRRLESPGTSGPSPC